MKHADLGLHTHYYTHKQTHILEYLHTYKLMIKGERIYSEKEVKKGHVASWEEGREGGLGDFEILGSRPDR